MLGTHVWVRDDVRGVGTVLRPPRPPVRRRHGERMVCSCAQIPEVRRPNEGPRRSGQDETAMTNRKVYLRTEFFFPRMTSAGGEKHKTHPWVC